MRVISWFFTIVGLALLILCFFKDEFILFAIPVVLLAAWTDEWASDVELEKFLGSHREKLQ